MCIRDSCGMSESTFVDNLITASRINLYFTAKVKGGLDIVMFNEKSKCYIFVGFLPPMPLEHVCAHFD